MFFASQDCSCICQAEHVSWGAQENIWGISPLATCPLPPSNATKLAALDPLTWLKCKVCSCFLLFVVQQTALVYLHKNAAWRCSTHQVVTCATLSPIPTPPGFWWQIHKVKALGRQKLSANPKGKASKSKVLSKRCKILPTFWTISKARQRNWAGYISNRIINPDFLRSLFCLHIICIPSFLIKAEKMFKKCSKKFRRNRWLGCVPYKAPSRKRGSVSLCQPYGNYRWKLTSNWRPGATIWSGRPPVLITLNRGCSAFSFPLFCVLHCVLCSCHRAEPTERRGG